MSHKRILSQMFDIRPTDETGDLDWEKINKVKKILKNYLEDESVPEYKKEKTHKIEKLFYRDPLFRLKSQPKSKYEDKSYSFLKPSPFNAVHDEFTIYQNESRTTGSRPWYSKLLPFRFLFSHFSTDLHRWSPVVRDEFHKSGRVQKNQRLEKEKKKTEKKDYFAFENFHYHENNSALSLFTKKEKNNYVAENLWNFKFFDLFRSAKTALNFKFKKTALAFAGSLCVLMLGFGIFTVLGTGFQIKGRVLGASTQGYNSLASAIGDIQSQNFTSSSLDFDTACEKFSSASSDLEKMGNITIQSSRFFPVVSQLSSGKNMIEAGKHIALAGKSLNDSLNIISQIKNPLNQNQNASLLEIFSSLEKNLAAANQELEISSSYLNGVKIDDLPSDKKDQFLILKTKLPDIIQTISGVSNNSQIFIDLLGGNGPRKYLFLFQNNQEIRATGGFIGSYGLLDINNGRIRNFTIDGIFNPDGQLTEKIVPPAPIQKISAAWSLHDSNWFPNFPTSAQKAISFFEKTGGPTADGVIALTPTVMQKLLQITGPIEMKDYGVTIDSDNFIDQTQDQVENNYDKTENQPKKILSDLAPLILDKLFSSRDLETIKKTISAFSEGLAEKHILLYSSNDDLEKLITREGWSGEILNTSKDYLSVINTNINGYKTDGIVSEKIEHFAEIQNDGSVIDTVTITRHHNGGSSQYDWYNKVNDDYMRVYVPEGSKLISVEGQTREFDDPPLDYNALGFTRDPDVEKEESNMDINKDTGTRTYNDSGKTIFANWVYVSPKETAVVKYKYLLPFKVPFENKNTVASSYSIIFQKQSGSIGDNLTSKITYPENYNAVWKYPDAVSINNNSLEYESDLKTDKFLGVTFVQDKNLILNH